ncbi:uncharacterized protein LOC126369114 [Pectinophora gossypiella]|uniref:uncharacterized protein LOC126369114 n=1 Tax=Pectinophora gossypiella TaxID=13191 RepID=UPI00214E18FC|nr:uncharacterized protein LOC126369114 [Pectinophora gossypiella]
MRSVSDPSLGTVGTTTQLVSQTSQTNIPTIQQTKKKDGYVGKSFFHGRLQQFTIALLQLPWHLHWQVTIFIAVTYNFIVLLLWTYVLESNSIFLYIATSVVEVIFILDFVINVLHYYWAAVRLHIRVYRRSFVALTYDGISILPFYMFRHYNFYLARERNNCDPTNIYYRYLACLYYCSCRCFNTIFGDAFPMRDNAKVLTTLIMITGFAVVRYWFVGALAWEYVLDNHLWADFVEQYHHMVKYLVDCGAPTYLVEQAKEYKHQLWNMKGGVLTSNYLMELPHCLKTDLIFDINVPYFHRTLLFRDTGEGFLRQISPLMTHQLYLEGQSIWSQGVVKSGMFCIKKGVIEMLSDEDDESPMIAFGEGTVLGELSLFYSIPAKVTVKAATYVELQILKRIHFMRAMAENPQTFSIIRERMCSRLQKMKAKQEDIEEYDKCDSRLIRTRYRPMKLFKDRLAGVEEDDPTFVDDSHLYYRDRNNQRLPKFTTDYMELYQLCNNVTTVDAPHIVLNSEFPWILRPDTSFTLMFSIIHFCIILYICIAFPLQAIDLDISDNQYVVNSIIMVGLLMNIYVQITTAIIDEGLSITTIGGITEYKLSKFGFYLDIMSVFPTSIFASSLDPSGITLAMEVSRLVPIIQVWHIWDYMGQWGATFHANVKVFFFFKNCAIFIIFCYWAGCFLYMYSCPKRLCTEGSWMQQLIYLETKLFVTRRAKHVRPILSSIVFGTAIFTGSGSSNYMPGSSDLVVVMIIFIIGMYLNCVYTAKICSVYFLSMARRLRFRQSMRELFYFLTVNRVPLKIKMRVHKYFTVQWYYNNAVSTTEILRDMSPSIQQEVLSIEMVDTLLFCPIFQECSQDFLQTVAGFASIAILPDNEVVQHAADINRDMYVIQKGYCKLVNHEGRNVKTLGPGDHFGVIEMMFGLPKVYTVWTATNCVLRRIEYSSLVQSWSSFPDVSEPLRFLQNSEELRSLAEQFEEARPVVGRIGKNINRIAQEIKESFVVLRTQTEKTEFTSVFEKLGYMRYCRYIFLPGCITPHGMFLKVWCALRVAFAVYYMIIIPYNISIHYQRHTCSYNYTDLFLYVDIIVMSYVAYYNEKSLLIAHPLLTTKQYLKTTFLFDVLSIFPFELLFRFVNDQIDQDICRINRLLLVQRISGAFSYWQGDIMQVNFVMVMLKHLPLVITLVNLMTAVIFMNSCTSITLPNDSTIYVRCDRALTNMYSEYDLGLRLNEYLVTLYWIFAIFVGCGCTAASITTAMDLVLITVLRITGFLYFAFMFGYISSTRTSTSKSLLEHNENTKDLENFLYQQNVDPNLTTKTIKYFEYVWKRTNGSKPQEICRYLHSALMEDTLVFMYERALREVPLFCNVERSFIRVVTQHLNEMYFLKGDTVVQCRDLQQNIYIIYKGKVDVLNSYNEMVSCMGPGGMFGNFSGKALSCSEVAIYASRSLDLLVLPSQTFFNLIKYYPKIQGPLQKAFTVSKDYIMPISVDTDGGSSNDESEGDEDRSGSLSNVSGFTNRSGSISDGFSKYDNISHSASQSDLSQAKSASSMSTFHSYMHISNLLRPGSFLYQCFGYVSCMVTTVNYILILYEVVTLNDCLILCWIQAFIDIFFYLKIYMSMHQGFLNKRGDFVTEGVKCRKRYRQHKLWGWTDVLVNFPLEFIAFIFPSPLRLIHYLRAHKMLRLVYIVDFYRKTAAELTNNLTTLQVVTTCVVIVLVIHTASCAWLTLMIASSPICYVRTVKVHLIDEEISDMRSQNYWDYVTSIYVIVSETTTTGGDEFVIEYLVAIGLLTFCLICGKIMSAVIVGSSMQVAYAKKHALANYENVTKCLMKVLSNQGLSVYQAKKFWDYVKHLWTYERGRQLPVLLAQTPHVRRCDLMSAMFGHHLRNCYLFADTGDAFLKHLTASLEYTAFFPGNYIVMAGDTEARMYWVASGTVSVVSIRSDLTETVHEQLSAGDVFGILQGLTRGMPHVFSYRSETKVSVLSLCLDHWINILQFFPEAHQIIYERSEYLFTQLSP